jgi:hypothetical protein
VIDIQSDDRYVVVSDLGCDGRQWISFATESTRGYLRILLYSAILPISKRIVTNGALVFTKDQRARHTSERTLRSDLPKRSQMVSQISSGRCT